MTLTARLPVLYLSRQYRPGDELPATDSALVDAWLESGAAYWADDEDTQTAPKVTAAAAEAGMPGKSSDADPEALVGKVPPRKKRTAKK